MQIQTNFSDIQGSPALEEHVAQCLEKSLRQVVERITRVEVHLHDDKHGRRGPDDKRCTMEARIAGEQPLAVESRASDIYKAVIDAAEKLARAVEHKLDRLKEF